MAIPEPSKSGCEPTELQYLWMGRVRDPLSLEAPMSHFADTRIVVRRLLVTIVPVLAGVVGDRAAAQSPAAAAPPVTCRQQTIGGAQYRVCEIPAAAVSRLQLTA